MSLQQSFRWPSAGPVVRTLVIANVVAWILEVVLVRAGVPVVEALALTPSLVVGEGYIWQPLTALLLHDPGSPAHVAFNMLWLWVFGGQLEPVWGRRRFLLRYLAFGLGGAAMVLVSAGLLWALARDSSFAARYLLAPHLGASGAVMGIVVAWGLGLGDREMNFFLLGRMKGRTFVALVVAWELLLALSLEPVSSASHFGGMLAGWWVSGRPKLGAGLFRRWQLRRRRRDIEKKLRVLEGEALGRPPGDDDPSRWN